MTIFVPTWVLWTLGIVIGVPVVAVVVGLMTLGGMFIYAFKDGIGWR